MDRLNQGEPGVDPDCARAHADVERELLGTDPLSAEERALLERHAAECAECAALVAALDLIATPPAPTAADYRAVLDGWRPAGNRTRRLGIGLVAAAVAAAAVVLLVLATGAPPTPERAPHAPTTAAAPLLALSLDAADGALDEGALVHSGDAPLMLRADPALAIGLDRDSALELTRLRADRVALGLRAGRVAASLDPDARIGLTVAASGATVVVTGTVFGVSIADDDVRVVVLSGAVRIESEQLPGGSLVVKEGQAVSLRDRSARAVAQTERSAVLALLELESPAVEPTAVPVETTTERAPSEPQASAVPVSAVPDPAGTTESGRAAPSSAPSTPAAAPPSADELIRVAREHRRSRNWHGAAAAYRQVLELHPERPEALTVLVPLAEIELEHLGRPDLALRHYNTYQRRQPRGALAEEASYGKCSALKALGWQEQEARALGEFLAGFPGSVHTPNVKSRLESISGNMD